eukprot:sb/3471206/
MGGRHVDFVNFVNINIQKTGDLLQLTCRPPPQVDLDHMPSPRAFKTHNYYEHLIPPGEMKIIHVIRHPKDVVCSQYHHMIKQPPGLIDYEGTFEEAVEFFLNGGFETGCYWRFNREYLENRDGHNILHLRYEELTMKKREGVRKINSFLGYPDLDGAQMERVICQANALTTVLARELGQANALTESDN